MPPSISETVYTITDWYDGARAGIADFGGLPHYYECPWDDGDYSETYLLTPVTDEVLQLALEADAIYQRWRAAFNAGKTPEETHPALLEERSRHEELQQILAQHLGIDPNNCINATAEFEYGKNLVSWTVID
ncbi:MAG: hypothetical protein ACRYFZ_17785 [Janthinobacterium lividum]